MRLLVSTGADPRLPTIKAPERRDPRQSGRGGGGHFRPAAAADRRAAYVAAPRGRRPRLQQGIRRQFASRRARRHARGGEVSGRGVRTPMSTTRDAEGNTAMHNAASRGDNEMILLSDFERRECESRQSPTVRPRSTWRTDRCSASSRFPRRSRSSRSSARRTITSACLADARLKPRATGSGLALSSQFSLPKERPASCPSGFPEWPGASSASIGARMRCRRSAPLRITIMQSTDIARARGVGQRVERGAVDHVAERISEQARSQIEVAQRSSASIPGPRSAANVRVKDDTPSTGSFSGASPENSM